MRQGLGRHHDSTTRPARLRAPLLRVGPRGSGEFKEITWDEALAHRHAAGCGEVRQRDPSKLAFFTGRDQSQALTGWWAQQFGTPNYAAHGGFCSVNMAAAGLYTFGGSFWEFGEPDWEHTRYFMLFGVAEDHASNPIKIALGKLKATGVKVVVVNPCAPATAPSPTNGSASGPAPTGCLSARWSTSCCSAEQIDLEYLVRYTNAPWLVIRRPRPASDDGLFARDADGKPLVFDKGPGRCAATATRGSQAGAVGTFKLADGRAARPVFALIAERFLSRTIHPTRRRDGDRRAGRHHPAHRCRAGARGVQADRDARYPLDRLEGPAARQDRSAGRSACTPCAASRPTRNGFHTCRILHLLQILLGSIDCPGGFRYKTPYPKLAPPFLKPRGKPGDVRPMQPLPGPSSVSLPGRTTCWSTRPGHHSASTKPSAGMRRSPHTG